MTIQMKAATYAALRTCLAAGDFVVGQPVWCEGATGQNDGAQGWGNIEAVGSHVDNGGTVIVGGSYAWIRDYVGAIKPAWFFDTTPGLNHAAGLQAYFDLISTTDFGAADVTGDFQTDVQLFFGPASGQIATRIISGRLKLLATTAITDLLAIRNCANIDWTGWVELTGVGGVTYGTRTCTNAVVVTESGRSNLPNFQLSNFLGDGIYADGASSNTALASIGTIVARGVGSAGSVSGGQMLSGTFSGAVRSGSSGSTVQTETITVSVLPPENIAADGVFVVINGDPYYVSSIDRPNSKLVLFPWINSSAPTSFDYLYGAALRTKGGDGNVVRAEMIDAINCGFGLLDQALYGVAGCNVVTQFCGAAVALGQTPSSSHLSTILTGLYCESNTFDFLAITRATMNSRIQVTYGTDYAKFRTLATPRLTGDAYNAVAPIFPGVSFEQNGKVIRPDLTAAQPNNSTQAVSVGGALTVHDIRRNTVTVNLTWDLSSHNLSGHSVADVRVYGTAATGIPSGTVTFKAISPSKVNNVDGATGVAYSSFSKPGLFLVWYDIALDNYVVTQL